MHESGGIDAATLSAIFWLPLAAPSVRATDKKKDDPNQIGDRDVGKCLNFYSVDKEIALGKQLADEVARQAKMDDDPLLTEIRQSRGAEPGAQLRRQDAVHVPGDRWRRLNAFALPGGYVFVYTGLIKMASEEDEFAGALAHEIAHVAARHMTCRATKDQLRAS